MQLKIENLIKITDFLWEIPKTYRQDMRVPARIFAKDAMLLDILQDRSLNQLINVATLPGIQKAALVMPDVHEGCGFPIGGVAAMSHPDGVISPGGIGYDINCGVRLLRSELFYEQLKPHLDRLAHALYQAVPSGVGQGGSLRLNKKKLDEILSDGAFSIIKDGYGEKEDVSHIESNGKIADADPSIVSDHAKERGKDQLGTMGGGNHFVEFDLVDEIFDEERAADFGLQKQQIVVLIHTGSRGLGHQIATDYIRLMLKNMERYKITIPDRELACAPFSSAQGSNYFHAMAAASNFAFANRQMITHEVRSAFYTILGKEQRLSLLYDVSHNIAKVEEHQIDGQLKKVIVHRKGATRAFPNQPVIIPGSMGSASYLLVGGEGAMIKSFGSCCHGAGRRMSRQMAKRTIDGKKLHEELQKQGIHIQTGSISALSEEAPLAYKNVDDVVDVVTKAEIAKKVARLRPVIVVKG